MPLVVHFMLDRLNSHIDMVHKRLIPRKHNLDDLSHPLGVNEVVIHIHILCVACLLNLELGDQICNTRVRHLDSQHEPLSIQVSSFLIVRSWELEGSHWLLVRMDKDLVL